MLLMMNLVHGNDDGTLGHLESTKDGFLVEDSSGADSYRTQPKTILFSFHPFSSIYIFRQQRLNLKLSQITARGYVAAARSALEYLRSSIS